MNLVRTERRRQSATSQWRGAGGGERGDCGEEEEDQGGVIMAVPGELDQEEGIPGVEDSASRLIAWPQLAQDYPDQGRIAEMEGEARARKPTM